MNLAPDQTTVNKHTNLGEIRRFFDTHYIVDILFLFSMTFTGRMLLSLVMPTHFTEPHYDQVVEATWLSAFFAIVYSFFSRVLKKGLFVPSHKSSAAPSVQSKSEVSSLEKINNS